MKYNLYKMVRKGEYERIKYFLEDGIINKKDIESYDYKVIKQALIYGNIKIAEIFIEYLEINNCDVKTILYDITGDSLTMYAIGKNGKSGSLSWLVGKTDTIIVPACYGAAMQGCNKMIKTIGKIYSDGVYIKRKVSTELLVYACKGGHLKAVKTIIEMGADVQFNTIRFRGNVMHRLYANVKIRKILESYGTDFSKIAG